MCSSKKRIRFAEIEKFKLPVYHRKGKVKYVSFYVVDPESIINGEPKMKRIRKRFDHYPSAKERDDAALRFREEISRKLKSGWNPLIAESANKGFELFDDVIGQYIRHIGKLLKEHAMKEKTHVDYNNRLKCLHEYNEWRPDKAVYAYQVNRTYIEGFLDYVYIDRDTSSRTRNNYLRWVSSFCTWMMNKGFIKENPAMGIALIREEEKRRKTLTKTNLKEMKEYLQETNPDFLLACMVHYYTLIRPGELAAIRLDDISIKEQTIYVGKEISKNRKDAKVTIPRKVLQMMIERGVFNHPSHHYLFGKKFVPSEEKADGRIFREEWARMRKALHWPDNLQFYSLKDTGITDAIDRVGLTVVKDQARHSSIDITNKYIRKEQMKAHPEYLDYDGDL